MRDHAAIPVGDWGLPADASVTFLAESENVTLLAQAFDGRRAVVRLHRPGYSDAVEIASEHAWIDALRKSRAVETPEVLRRSDGTTVGRARYGGEWRNAAAFAFMTGREPPVDAELRSWFARLGGLTARLHRHSRAWTPPAGFRRKRWSFDTTLGSRPHWGDWRNALGLDGAGRELLARAVDAIASRLSAYGTAPARFGLIHADLRLANLLVDGDRLGVIDFDDCGFGWFMYDFAASLSFIEHETIAHDLRDAWLLGYRAEAELAVADEAMLPVFVMLRRILLTAWIASRSQAEAARTLGAAFTEGTLALADGFLSRVSAG